jgi:alcohol dehydrogenase/acrylyl-CoA reductase (NADPH)
MNDKFKAIVLSQSGEKFSREIKTLDKSFLKHGDVLVKVDYSGLNYKDALILNNGGKLVKEFPHIPGIDFSGKVVESVSCKASLTKSHFFSPRIINKLLHTLSWL